MKQKYPNGMTLILKFQCQVSHAKPREPGISYALTEIFFLLA
jgi:hypothetical protein